MAREKHVEKGGRTAPSSIRLSPATDALVRAEARRARRSRSAILAAAADEGIRQRAFPGIGFRGSDARRRPWVIGSGLDVWEIVEAYRDLGESIERTLAKTDIEEGHLRLALAYYERFPEEVDEAIAENAATAREFATRFPSFSVPSD